MDETHLNLKQDSLLAQAVFNAIKLKKNTLQVFICTEESAATRCFDVLSSLGGPSQAKHLGHLPGLVQSGTFRFENANRIVASRLRTLLKITANDLRILVTTVNGFHRVVPHQNWLNQHQIILKPQEEWDQELLIETLESYGYRSVSRVEEPGEWALRGQILDLFSPAQRHPIRVTFLGDIIESLRAFRPKEQRSFENRASCSLLPTREFLWPQGESLKEAHEKLNHALLSQGLTGTTRADLLEHLATATPFPGIDDVFCHFAATPLVGFQTWLKEHCQQHGLTLQVSLVGTGHGEKATELMSLYDDAVGTGRYRRLLTARKEQLFPGLPGFAQNPLEAIGKGGEFHADAGPNPFLPDDDLCQIIGSMNSLKMAQKSIMIHDLFKQKKISGITIVTPSSESWAETAGVLAGLSPLWSAAPLTGEGTVANLMTTGISPTDADITVVVGDINLGFVMNRGNSSKKNLLLSESWLRGMHKSHGLDLIETEAEDPSQSSRDNAQKLLALHSADFAVGELVVHVHYGRARYLGLSTQTIAQTTGDYLVLQFAGNDKIYVPVHRLGLVQRYLGGSGTSSDGDGCLDSLSAAKEWEKRKAKAREDAQKIARELLEHQAKRATTPGHAFSRVDEECVAFESSFPYDETPCQLRAMREIHADMARPKAMDRLLCGDVGFGKTELAMRAAFRAVLDKKQVAVLVPTTILAHQHGRSFLERFEKFPVKIRVLDRSISTQNALKIKEELQTGQCDIIIGTHRLLAGDLPFKDLGLVIVDEEQRFGVQQKEKLKTLCYGVDVLTMSATPIPRTLQMAMLGLRDLSLLSTPPKARLAVKTIVTPFEEGTVKEAIEAEVARGGQVFYVHNRVEELETTQAFLQQLCPNLRILVGHGKMQQKKLDETIMNFMDGKADLLLCTTIIESGIDMPGVNTIIIQNADHFGLAQLYQLRGRVGRRSTKGYAYFLLSPGSHRESEGSMRLGILADHQDLGSGFVIASHDLEIRGGGSLLGEDQNGSVNDVGLETYSNMLMEAIQNHGGIKIRAETDVEIQLPLAAQVPEQYIEDPRERLRVYRRFFGTRTEEVLMDLLRELEDVYGPCPPGIVQLAEIARLRRWLLSIGAVSLVVKEDNTELRLAPEMLQSTEDDSQRLISRLLDAVNRHQKGARITPDGRVILPVRKMMFQNAAADALATLKSFLARVAGESKG